MLLDVQFMYKLCVCVCVCEEEGEQERPCILYPCLPTSSINIFTISVHLLSFSLFFFFKLQVFPRDSLCAKHSTLYHFSLLYCCVKQRTEQ